MYPQGLNIINNSNNNNNITTRINITLPLDLMSHVELLLFVILMLPLLNSKL